MNIGAIRRLGNFGVSYRVRGIYYVLCSIGLIDNCAVFTLDLCVKRRFQPLRVVFAVI
jgi:hypothetical protein